jgi:hypothetical protein
MIWTVAGKPRRAGEDREDVPDDPNILFLRSHKDDEIIGIKGGAKGDGTDLEIMK